MVVIRGRLTPEIGAIVQRALESAADQLFRELVGTPDGDRVVDEVTPGQGRADALARVAEVALTHELDRGTVGDRYQVVVHVDRAALHSATTASDPNTGHARTMVPATAAVPRAITAVRAGHTTSGNAR